MSDEDKSNKAMTVANQVASGADWLAIRSNKEQLVSRLRLMIVNGKKLSDDDIFALAIYAQANDLNPFNGECYPMPGIGPIPGINGWRKKANEQLYFEALIFGFKDGAHYNVKFVPATTEEAVFDPAKDIAYKAILTDWVSSTRWRREFFAALNALKDAGVEKPSTMAFELVGEMPSWIGVGVVRQGENFGGDKFDRHERAKKRAEKTATRKRFSAISLDARYEPASDDVIESTFVTEDMTPVKKTEAQIQRELGFDDPEPEPQPEPPAFDLKAAWKEDAKVSYDTAITVKDRQGTPYIQLETGTLKFMRNSLVEHKKKESEKDNLDGMEECLLKIATIDAIIEARG